MLAVLCAVFLVSGCRAIGALGVLLSPPQVQKPEIELTRGRLAIVIDAARREQSNPVFESALHNGIVELLRENKVPSQVVAYEDLVRLRQSNADYLTWSYQRIGRALEAEQVLSVRIEDLRLAPGRGEPVVTPHVELTLKLIGVREPPEKARLWPRKDPEPDGRTVAHERPARQAESVDVLDAEAAKLARETAYYVARHFYKYDLEEKPPREP